MIRTDIISARRRTLLGPVGLCLATLGLAACGSTSGDRGDVIHKGKYKPYRAYVVGVPYTIKGIRYYPKEDMNYEETGIASWYGPGFHGKRTANGEEYNQDAMTAAHRTLPMPTIVKVTNLENGKSIVVRINDRGPFADDRIIDLSREAARRIRMIRNGTARVRVRILRKETLALKRSGQTYANMAALNRRYVDGEGSGTVIKAPPPHRALAARPVSRPTAPPPAGASAASPHTASGTMAAAGASGASGAAPRRLVGVPPRNGSRAWQGDVPPSDRRATSGNDTSDRDLRRADSPDVRNTAASTNGERTSGATRTARDRSDDRAGRNGERFRPLARRSTATRRDRDGKFHGRRPVLKPAPAAGRIYVQAAAYTEKSQARRISRRLGSLAASRVTAVQIRDTVFYRVRLGPVRTPAEGDRLLARVVSMGYRDARVVIDPARR